MFVLPQLLVSFHDVDGFSKDIGFECLYLLVYVASMCRNVGHYFGFVKYMDGQSAANGSCHKIRLVYVVC